MRWALVGLIGACGCLHDDLVHCASGIACPADLVCDDAHTTCVEPDQLASCDGKPDLAECLVDGACHDGVCLPVGCGNGRRDPGEMCDDGNTASADGCSADCGSTETCGNAQIDPVNREQCDPGDRVNHDGCDSRCTLEEPDWSPYLQLSAHPPRQQAAFTYDSARDRLVVFGGFEDFNNTRATTTLEWDGIRRTWLDRTPATAPTSRIGAGLAYDVARGVSVLFGGSDFGGTVADTWLWDGEQWKFIETPNGPQARVYPQMAYDSKRRRVVMFGGRGNTGVDLADTWSWDGTTWTELHPTTVPNKRERGQMAYDPIRDEIVLVGGVDMQGRGDVWIFDGNDWRAGPSIVELRFAGALVWDASRSVLALVGGSGNADYSWDGTAWRNDGPSLFVARFYPFVYYDPRRGRLVGGLGYNSMTNTMLPDVLERVGGWTALLLNPAPSGAGRQAPMMAYDVLRARIVMFGGNPGTGDKGETFELEHGAWVDRAVTGPPARDRGAVSYDVARGRMVVWGGHATDPLVWEWDGAAWTSIAPAGAAPPLRGVTAMAYVPGVGSVLSCGEIALGQSSDDTWIWDGATWTDMTAASGTPGPRIGHMMAYDPDRQELVLFGGANGMVRLGDTWTWTMSTGWVQRTPPTSPPPRSRGAMVWDPVRHRMLLVGGLIGVTRIDEVWAWDGTTWTRLFTDQRIDTGLVEPGVAYDPVEGAVFAEALGLFRFQWRGTGADDACENAVDRDGDALAGCADPDCWALCNPLCPLATSCAAPGCGDGACDAARETCRSCPSDCGACPVVCGDAHCDGEDTLCPGDCP